MKHTTILISVLAVAACGGKKSEPAPPKNPEPEPPPAPEPKPEPPPEPPPPPPAKRAQAELSPVKGAKLKGATVTFAQVEGKPVTVGSTGWFDGIKSGRYHLVVHDGAACGPNATKAGKPGADIRFVATAGMDALDVTEPAAVQIEGDGSIIGHTLVLHDDSKGKPGKALACGTIAAVTP